MDARIGARSLLRDRVFTIVAALTLSIGVALNAAMFSVVNAVLLRPPVYANPEQLVVIDNRPPNAQITFVSPAEFFDYRRMSQTTTQIAQAISSGGTHHVSVCCLICQDRRRRSHPSADIVL